MKKFILLLIAVISFTACKNSKEASLESVNKTLTVYPQLIKSRVAAEDLYKLELIAHQTDSLLNSIYDSLDDSIKSKVNFDLGLSSIDILEFDFSRTYDLLDSISISKYIQENDSAKLWFRNCFLYTVYKLNEVDSIKVIMIDDSTFEAVHPSYREQFTIKGSLQDGAPYYEFEFYERIHTGRSEEPKNLKGGKLPSTEVSGFC